MEYRIVFLLSVGLIVSADGERGKSFNHYFIAFLLLLVV
jgi:hypothetical protein